MENSLSQNISQRQKLLLSQRQQQALDLLHLPLQALDLKISDELAKNPLLEELAPAKEELPQESKAQDEEAEDKISDIEAARTLWGDDLPRGSAYANSDDNEDFWGNTAAPPPSMIDQLEAEIATSDLSERMTFLADVIIANLDDNGYLGSHPADIAMLCDADMDEIEEALALVQSFDPPGIAARSLGECLRLQLKRADKLTPLLEKLTGDDSLEEIAANHIPALARKLGVSVEQLQSAIAELKKLDPAPGAVLSAAAVQVKEPEIEIVRKGSGYVVNTLHNRQRRLVISPQYEKLLDNPEISSADRSYIEEMIRNAKELIEALYLRGDTLTGIGNVLIRTQGAFLDYGPEELRPLTMKQAGEMLDLNESTISRAVNEKYVRTPQGVFELKYFFSSGFKSEEGEDVAARAVQEKIRALIAAEDPHDPLSDEKLAKLLAADGLNVARRTIAKYRDILKIPSTRLRKKFE